MKPVLILLALILTAPAMAAHQTEEEPRQNIRRFGLYVGRSEGDAGKAKLRYATSDAVALSKVMRELGGVDDKDSFLVLNPRPTELQARFKALKNRIHQAESHHLRTEVLFYYSGHSDGEGLLLGEEKFDYKLLRKMILELAADISVIILDSCASGNFTRLKGGHRAPPFLSDALTKLKGYVALTSSSSDEAAQESDQIKGSYFTHYLISGLRGAADFSSNRKITLNEAYQYAYNETLARTERTSAGPQHPAYNIQLSGRGELVMTDLRRTNAQFVIDPNLVGRFLIKDHSDNIVAEVDKTSNRPMVVGVEAGRYSIVLTKDKKFSRADLRVTENQSTAVSASDFVSFKPEVTTSRGSVLTTENDSTPARWRLTLASLYAYRARGAEDSFGIQGTGDLRLSRRVDASLLFGIRAPAGGNPIQDGAHMHAGLEVAMDPLAPNDSPFGIQLTAGGSTVGWSQGVIFGAPRDTNEIMGTFCVGTRVNWQLNRDIALRVAFHLNILMLVAEAGVTFRL